jgi:general secretion pathway protein J
MRSDVRRHFFISGLTLVELLVAISVLAIIAVLGWRGLDSITRARASLNQDLEQTRGIQLAFAQLQSDCANAVTSTQLQGRMPVVIDSAHVTITRTVYADTQPTRLQLVTYRLRDGMLLREESPATRDLAQLDQYGQVAASGNAGSAMRPIRLQSGVQELALRVWANDGGGWRDSAGAAAGALTSRGAMMNPQAGTTSTQTAWSGLQISMRLSGRDATLTKIFLLGPA